MFNGVVDTPVKKKSSKKSSSKKLKQVVSVGFDNPVYDVKDKENTDSMVSVSLEEDEIQLPDGVEHDGTGTDVYYNVGTTQRVGQSVLGFICQALLIQLPLDYLRVWCMVSLRTLRLTAGAVNHPIKALLGLKIRSMMRMLRR